MDIKLERNHSGMFTITEMGGLHFIVEWCESDLKWKVSNYGTGFKSREAAEQVLRRHCQVWGGCWKYCAPAATEVAA